MKHPPYPSLAHPLFFAPFFSLPFPQTVFFALLRLLYSIRTSINRIITTAPRRPNRDSMNQIKRIALFSLCAALSMVAAIPTGAFGGDTTTRISVDAANTQGNGTSSTSFINAPGELVAFMSSSSNWVAGDTNNVADIFLKSRSDNSLEWISRTTAGGFPNGTSVNPSISADGRFVVFDSLASNIVINDFNDVADVFIRDRHLGTTERVSESPGMPGAGWFEFSSFSRISDDGNWVVFRTAHDHAPNDTNGFTDIYIWNRLDDTFELVSQYQGIAGNADSTAPDISSDGRYIVFQTGANNFPDGGTGFNQDIYWIDRVLGTMERISIPATPGGSDISSDPRVSNDGRFVTFWSNSPTLVPGDTNGLSDVFVVDRQLDTITRINEGPNGEQTAHTSAYPDISGDGLIVVYESLSNVLVPDDTNNRYDIFAYDLTTGTTTRISLTATNAQGNGDSERAALPVSGNVIAFQSRATNLVPGDTNALTDVYVRGEAPIPTTPTPTPVASTPTPTATGIPPTATPTTTIVPATTTPTSTTIPATLTPTSTTTSSTATPTTTPIPATPTPTTTVVPPTPSATVTPTITTTPPNRRTLYLPLVYRADE